MSNGTITGTVQSNPQPISHAKQAKPLPAFTPPVPSSAPPVPATANNHNTHHPNHNSAPNTRNHPNTVNGTHNHNQSNARSKKKAEPAVDAAQMYESLKNRIQALEEEEVLEEEEERAFAEEAQKSVRGLEENAIHNKYIELFAELKRMERDHAKEKQKLVKDKDAAKSQLTKANQTKTKMENLARELQKDNKRLREDGKRLAQCVEDAQEELMQMKNDISKRVDKAKMQDLKYREMPDIVVKVVCRYRAELFFKISRKTKLLRLFNAWTERMESSGGVGIGKKNKGSGDGNTSGKGDGGGGGNTPNGLPKPENPPPVTPMQFVFMYNGRAVEADQTPEEAGMEDGDEILAIELMDLTQAADDVEELSEPRRHKLKKDWTDDPQEAKRSLEEIFDGVVRERLKEVLRQYELRERHFECVIRSKELEVLLSRARAAEQKQLADNDKARAEKQQDENHRIKKELEELQNGQTMLIDKLIACCKEVTKTFANQPNAERTQRLFASLREELEKRNNTTKVADGPVGG